jgi:cysteine-S-conjugate beta-lyase
MHYNFDEIVNRSDSNSVKVDLRKWVFGNKEVIPLWVADMDFRTPDFVINAISKRLEHDILGYTYIPDSFYDSIIQWNNRRHQWPIKKEWISFSPGIVPAINLLIMSFTGTGDGIIIQPPVYFPFFSAIKNHNRRLVTNPLKFENGSYSMDFNDLEKKMDEGVRMLILSNPHNPTGNIWPADVLQHLAQMCLERKILLISDEIHCDLVYPGFRHVPTAGLSDKIAMNTITCMSASKTFNLAGLSTAYLVIRDSQLRQQYEKVLDQVHVGAGNIFGFIACEAAYNNGDLWRNQLMEYIAENYRFLNSFLQNRIHMIKSIEPQATFLVWLDCRELNMTSEQLKNFMILDAGLGMNEGIQFGTEGTGFMRINIGCPRMILNNALVKLQNAIKKYFGK